MLFVLSDISTISRKLIDTQFSGGGDHGHVLMVVGFTTTYAISAYHQ